MSTAPNVRDNGTGQAWNSLTNAQRVTAAVGDNRVWTGGNVTSQVPIALDPLVNLFATGTLTAGYAFGTARFGPPATPANFMLVDDGNALMDPSINADLDANFRLDLTPALYREEGWRTNEGTALIGTCNTTVSVLEEGGIVIGANVQAQDNVCRASSPNKALYLRCMNDYRKDLQDQGLISGRQGGQITSCAARNRF